MVAGGCALCSVVKSATNLIRCPASCFPVTFAAEMISVSSLISCFSLGSFACKAGSRTVSARGRAGISFTSGLSNLYMSTAFMNSSKSSPDVVPARSWLTSCRVMSIGSTDAALVVSPPASASASSSSSIAESKLLSSSDDESPDESASGSGSPPAPCWS